MFKACFVKDEALRRKGFSFETVFELSTTCLREGISSSEDESWFEHLEQLLDTDGVPSHGQTDDFEGIVE
jgi:hypothetical protein